MDEFSDFSQFDEVNPLVSKFESMLLKGENPAFDIEEYEEIIEYYITNSVDHAEKVVEYALSQYPWSSAILLKKAVVLAHKTEFSEAFEIVKTVKGIDANDIELYITLSYIYRLENKHDKSLLALQRALTFNEEVDEVYFDMAEDYAILGDVNSEIDCLQKSLSVNYQHNEALDRLFWTYRSTERFSEAIEYFTTFVEKYPLRQMAWEKLGFSYYELDLYEKSIEAFEYALSIDDSIPAYSGLAQAYWKTLRYDKAIEVFKDSLLVFPYVPNVNNLIGWIYLDLNDFSNAQKYFLNEIFLDSSTRNAWKGLAQVYIYNDDFENAFDCLTRSFVFEDLDLGSVEQLIQLSFQLDKPFEKTEEVLVKLTGMYPKNPEIWIKYSEFLYDTARENEAKEVLEKSLNKVDSPALIYFRLAAYYYLDNNEVLGHMNLIAGMNTDPKLVGTMFDFSQLLYKYEPLVSLLDSLNLDNENNENN
jgi:tetratricopeptide (TPR) repeat protein